MQILKLSNYEDIIKGGSSKPILITATSKDGVEKPYVMKTYKKNYVEENFSVAKEILITELAKDFDLPVPNYGIIKINNEELIDFYTKNEIELLDNGYKFCTEYHEGYVIMSSIASSNFLKDYKTENLFAFDNLIMNVDRGGFRNKPNLLLKDEEMLLIDHEQTFPFINGFPSSKPINFYSVFNNYYYQNHIFWNTLKKRQKAKKEMLFEEFMEILRTLNVEKYRALFDEMDKYDIAYGEINTIFAYLYWSKDNCNYIKKVLIDRLK